MRKNLIQSHELSLQVTSMADIFMILMVFLLKSYSTSLVQITPSSGMKLPLAQAQGVELDSLKVEVSEKLIQIESKPVVELKNFQFDLKDLEKNHLSKTLSRAFSAERKKQLFIAQTNKQIQVESKLIVVADQRAPYSTIKAVLASAAVNGYTDFKLAIVNQE